MWKIDYAILFYVLVVASGTSQMNLAKKLALTFPFPYDSPNKRSVSIGFDSKF